MSARAVRVNLLVVGYSAPEAAIRITIRDERGLAPTPDRNVHIAGIRSDEIAIQKRDIDRNGAETAIGKRIGITIITGTVGMPPP